MKVISFRLPKTRQEAFRLQVDRQPYLYDKLHQHPETQLMLIVKSEGTVIAGDYVGRFMEGDLFIIGSGQPHVFRNDNKYLKSRSEDSAEAISIYFDSEQSSFWQLEDLSSLKTFLQDSSKGFKVEGTTKDEASRLILSMPTRSGVDRFITFFTLLQLLGQSKELMTLSALPAMKNPAPENALRAGEEKRMNDILRFTFDESHRKIYLHEAASVANLSSEAFCRYFKVRARKTYTTFVHEVRVSKACQLLIASDKSVQEICFETGFNNLSHFNRVFRRVTGKTPSGYSTALSPLPG